MKSMKAVFFTADGLLATGEVPNPPERSIMREYQISSGRITDPEPRDASATFGRKIYVLSEVVQLRERFGQLAIYEEARTR